MSIDVKDWTPEQRERLLAWILVPPPRWLDPLAWVLFTVPGGRPLGERLRRWETRRAVALLRAKKSGASQAPDRAEGVDGPAAVAPPSAPSPEGRA